jgi:hypothetical protein
MYKNKIERRINIDYRGEKNRHPICCHVNEKFFIHVTIKKHLSISLLRFYLIDNKYKHNKKISFLIIQKSNHYNFLINPK